MPSFYAGQPPAHMSNPHLTEYGQRYEQPYYHDGFNYATTFGDYRPNAPQDVGPLLPDPFQRFNKSVPPSAYSHPSGFVNPAPDTANPIGAPMIAPLRIDGRYLPAQPEYTQPQQRSFTGYQEKPAKEEKAVGGVSAVLDYNVDQMVQFVMETSAGMYELRSSRIVLADIDLLRSVKPRSYSNYAFRKWVLQVLNATRLPSATILLSLSYLALRIKKESECGAVARPERTIYQMLTVSLILGSKFADDNTFQNKSWAEVSQIPTAELNRDELQWLTSFGHRLHYDPHCADGYKAFEDMWKAFQSRPTPGPVLQPIDTNVPRHHPNRDLTPPAFYHSFDKPEAHKGHMDPTRVEHQYPTPSYTPAYASFDPWFGPRPAMHESPASAPRTAPQTPEYYGGLPTAWSATPARFVRQGSLGYPPITPFTPQSFAPQATNWNAPHGNSYLELSPSDWNCHGALCQCVSCRHAQILGTRFAPMVVG